MERERYQRDRERQTEREMERERGRKEREREGGKGEGREKEQGGGRERLFRSCPSLTPLFHSCRYRQRSRDTLGNLSGSGGDICLRKYVFIIYNIIIYVCWY